MVSEAMNEELKRWREFFNVTQSQLAREMRVSPSVISDYEGGRQRNPGSKFLKRYVESLIRIDMERGGKIVRLLSGRNEEQREESILYIHEYRVPISAREIIEATRSEALINENKLDTLLYGITVLDSIAAILSLSGEAFYRIYGTSSERALIFTGVNMGRSPMVAIRVYPLKPRMVILHGPPSIDSLAIKLAEKENIILAVSKIISVEDLISSLKALKVREKL